MILCVSFIDGFLASKCWFLYLFIETTFTDQQEVLASHLSVLVLEPSYMCEKQHLLTKVSVFISLVLSVLLESFVCSADRQPTM